MWEIKPILTSLFRHRSSTLLIVLQVAVTLAVVVNAIHIIEERATRMQTKSGVAERELFNFSVSEFGDDYDIEQRIRSDLQAIKAIPGVKNAVILDQVPMRGGGNSTGIANKPPGSSDSIGTGAGYSDATEQTLDTLGVELIAGRNFRAEEVMYTDNWRSVPEVIIITEDLAKTLYPEESALGKQVYVGSNALTVIGIVKKLVSPWVHSSMHERNFIIPKMTLDKFRRVVVRTDADAQASVMKMVEQVLLQSNRNRVITNMSTFYELRENAYRGDSAMSKVLSLVIILLVSITALGIIGIISFNVSRRSKQIGTRRALGATKQDIQRYFLVENFLVTAIGLSLGIVLAIGLSAFLVKQFELTPFVWWYLPAVMAFLSLVGLLSAWIPARRAASISPALATQSV